MKQTLLYLVLLFFSSAISSQVKGSEISIGTNYTIQSKYLGQDIDIQIYLPDSYKSTKQKYPVLYVLDGQWFFANGVAIQKSLRTPGFIPEMIVVGIRSLRSIRMDLFYSEKEKFTKFLEKEAVAFIDSNYRTNKNRVLFGWEVAAYYASEIILKKESLFNGAITTNGGYASKKYIKDFITEKKSNNRYLYLVNSRKDIYNIGSTDEFAGFLKELSPKKLIWKYELLDDEIHESLAHVALYKGLTYYYHNYPSLAFETIKYYEDLGGMEYLTSYFNERGERFGFPKEVDNSTKNTLIWLAWNRDNFKYFSFFMKEFKDVLETKRYASAYWQNRLGQFYLKHKDYNNAIKHFTIGVEKYANTSRDSLMFKGLGDAYLKKGMKKKAEEAYKRANKQ